MKNTFIKFALLTTLMAQSGYSQVHYVWTNNLAGAASGGWDNVNNWSPHGLPVTGDTADFSTLAITNVSTISLDGNQTNASLIFGDIFPQGTWVVDTSGTLTLESAIGTPTISVTNQTATIQATILGAQGFTKLGAGTLVLSSANTYSGPTTNNAGTLTIGSAGSGVADAPTSGPFGTGPLVLNAGTLNTATGGGIVYNSIVVPTGATVSMGTTVSGVQLALGGGISGGGTINESGSQTAGTHLSGNNSGFTGVFNSTGGGSHRVRIDNPASGSASAAWNASATVTDGWGFTGFGAINSIDFGSFSGNGTLRSDNGNNTTVIFSIGALNTSTTFSGTIVANGSQLIAINKVGTGTLILSGNNTYTGFTTISNGVVQLGAAGGAGMFNSALVTNYSKLTFSYNRADTFAFPAVQVTGTGSLLFTNAGAGVMTLTGTNNETGDTTIAAGAIRLLNRFALPGGPGVGNLVMNGTLDVNSNSIVLNGLSGGGIVDNMNTNGGVQILTIGSNDVSSVFSGAIKCSAAPTNGTGLAVTKVGAGTIAISGANTYNGNTTINGGELDITTSHAGGGGVTVNSGTAFGVVVNSAGSVPIATLTVNNTSILSFSGLSSTTIAPLTATNLAPSGTVTINVAGSFVSGSQYPLIKFSNYASAGGFALGTLPAGTTANLVTNGGFIKLNVTVATPLVWKGNVSTNWDIATTANWTQSAVASTYADGQTVQFNDTASTGAVNLSANVAPAGVLVTNNSLSYAFNSASGKGIGGTAGLTKTGTGTLTLSGLTNTYTGITTVNGGTAVVNADNNLGNAGGLVLNGGALSAATSLTLNANRSLVVGPATGSGVGTLDVASGQTLTFNGVVANNLAGTGSLIKTGTGTLALNGANTYGGSTMVSAGTLAITAAQQNGSPITVNDGATLAVSRTGGVTLPVSTLTLGSGGATAIQFGNLSSANAVITATNLTTSGTVTVSIPTGVPALGEVPLIKYSGSIGGSGFGAFTLPVLPPGVTAVLTNDTANKIVGLLAQSVSSLTWTGTNGPLWDIGITTNWSFLGNNVTFQQGSGVVVDDTAFTNLLNLTSAAGVFSMSVTNNALNYTLAGNGALNGPMTLTKSGNGSFTLANLANNNYTGGTVIQQGTLDARSGGSLGSGPITLAGGVLENNSATTVTLVNNVTAQTNTTSVLQTTGGADPQLALNGNLSGGGTVVAFLQGGSLGGMGLSGDNSGFTGTFITSNNASMRFNFNTTSSGSASASWILNSAGTDNQRISFGNGTISFGALSGNGNCRQDVPNTLSILRVGDLNLNCSWGGTLNQGNGTQRLGILKAGTATWTITASQPFTGPTSISNGVLALANDPITLADGAIPNTASIDIAAGAMLDVTGRSDGTLTTGGTQTLQGRGIINGTLTVGGLVAPGDGVSGNVGTLTVSNSVNLQNLTWMKLSGAASDRIASPVAINYSGTLVVTNSGAALTPGTVFTLFSSPTFNGSSFGGIVLPNYLSFDTSNLGVNGTITFLGYSRPVISSVDFSTLNISSITLNATNGLPGGPVIILTTTNIALPVNAWTPIMTNAFDGGGNYTEIITVDPAAPKQFYMLTVQ